MKIFNYNFWYRLYSGLQNITYEIIEMDKGGSVRNGQRLWLLRFIELRTRIKARDKQLPEMKKAADVLGSRQLLK